jgi:hypothetical protein
MNVLSYLTGVAERWIHTHTPMQSVSSSKLFAVRVVAAHGQKFDLTPPAMGPKNELANEIAMIAFRHMIPGAKTQPMAAPVVESEKKKKHKSKKHKKKNKDCDGQTLSGTLWIPRVDCSMIASSGVPCT